ncbi:hypothetical protein FHX74_000051 [Friedmanniella endophytica]|uniref:Zinc-finger n=1 Tax=Microlunatus kandeliicorticis TaxID=1759536 RepID=A0A7W3INS7_9ACTN|nr:anti-sigma factor [Microlunatus kandeliicorticis]MBA8792457.1 hypothetical protein [Microlunatus kandeliicorticis]
MHTSPEVIAVMVLGDGGGTDEDRAHVESCPECQAELDAYRHTYRLAQELVADVLQKPADHVWHRISHEIEMHRSAVDAHRRSSVATTTLAQRIDELERALDDDADDLDEDWRHVSAPAGFGSAAELAHANLAARPDWPGAHGTAIVESDDEDHRTLHISMRLGLLPAHHDASVGAQLAAWLIAPDLSGMVRLGQLPRVEDTDTSFPLPEDVDLLRYPVVDLSRQPAEDDGSAAHSGDSIVRGVLS